MPVPIVVKEIERLSQQEGMTDSEIAEYLGYSRATINRARQQHGIATANKQNRKDKRYRCQSCGEEVFIRRHARRRLFCPACEIKGGYAETIG